MNDLRALYQEIIIDHNRAPRHFYEMEDATQSIDGFNPLCGDKVTVYLQVKDNIVEKVSFQGSGCAISVASASLMSEYLQGKAVAEVEQVFAQFHQLMTAADYSATGALGKLEVLAGVRDYPSRIKCATLAWHAMHSALLKQSAPVTTE